MDWPCSTKNYTIVLSTYLMMIRLWIIVGTFLRRRWRWWRTRSRTKRRSSTIGRDVGRCQRYGRSNICSCIKIYIVKIRASWSKRIVNIRKRERDKVSNPGNFSTQILKACSNEIQNIKMWNVQIILYNSIFRFLSSYFFTFFISRFICLAWHPL